VGLINFWSQKSTLDQLDKDMSNMKLYVTHVSGCIAEIDACWIGNKDKEKVVSAISSHLHIVNKSNNDLNIFKQTATFILVKMNELGSLIGLSIPAIANMCFPGLFSEVRIYPRIQIDTAALRTVADKIEGERKYLEETSFSIGNTKNIIDDVILNMNGLGKLLKDLDREVAEQKQENQKIVNGIRHICDLYENAENRLNEKIAALEVLGTSVAGDTPVVTPPPPVTKERLTGTASVELSTDVKAGKIRQVIQKWDPELGFGDGKDYDPSVWGQYDNISSSACGVAATSMALSWLGKDVSVQTICELNIKHGAGADSMSSWDYLGCKCTRSASEGSTKDIDEALSLFNSYPNTYAPPIMYLTSPHFVVIIGQTDTEYTILDPGYRGVRTLRKPASYSEVKQFSLT